MDLVPPKLLTILDSNVPEDEAGIYDPDATYAKDALCIQDHHVFKSLQDANTGHDPATSATWWKDLGATNAYRLIDNLVYSQTQHADEVDVTVTASNANCVSLFGLDATSVTFTLTDLATSNAVWTQTVDLRRGEVSDWLEYFFDPIEFAASMALTTVPLFGNSALRIQVSKPEDTAKIGTVILGRNYFIGDTLHGAQFSILSFSRKERNEWGEVYLAKGNNAQTMSLDVVVENRVLDMVKRRFQAVEGTVIVVIGDSSDDGFESLLILGFFQDFRVVIEGPTVSTCALNVEGLV